MNYTVSLRAIIPSQETTRAMGRRRYQHPDVQQTAGKRKSDRRWFFRARVDALLGEAETGRVEDRIYLGHVSEMNRREAEKARDVALKSINSPDVILTSQILFGSVIDRWLATLNARDSTLRNYTSAADAHLRPQWGKVRMCDITPIAVEDWLIAKAKTCSKATLDMVRHRFITIWKRAIFWQFTREICPTSGMPQITRVGKPARVKTLPTLEQFHHFIYLLEEPYRSIVVVCTFTGLRIGEAMALTAGQLNAETATLTEQAIQARHSVIGPLKGSHSGRTVPMRHMRGDIVVPFDAAPGDRPYLVGYRSIHRAIKEAARVADIDYPGFGCHTFRRMHNTLFRQNSTAPNTRLAMSQMGHGDAKTNDLYYIPDDSDVQQRAGVVSAIHQKVMGSVQ